MNSKLLFKLINEKNYDSITFQGQNISLKDLKAQILVRLGQKQVTGPLQGKDRYRNKDDILIYDESKQRESTLIASDSRVLVERISIPLHLVGEGYPYYMSQEASLASEQNKLSYKEIETRYLVHNTRYFIIRSTCLNDIERSIRESSWTTTNNNEITLSKALSKNKNVILIFSASNTSQFLGYARMMVSSDSSNYKIWQAKEDCMKPGSTIKLKWLRMCNVSFSRFSHLRNKLNNHEFISESRDMQEEIPQEVGLEMCRMFELSVGKYKSKESFLGLLASEISMEACTTRAQTDDERSQSDRERESGMEYLEEEEKANILGGVNVNSVYFTDDWKELLQKDSHKTLSEPKNESEGSLESPYVASTQMSVTRPPPPSSPRPQKTSVYPAYSQRYMNYQKPKYFYGLSERIGHDDEKKEKRDRGIKQREWKNPGRGRMSEKERERDHERSRDNSMTKSDSQPRRQ